MGGALLASSGEARAYGISVPYGFQTPDGSFVLPNAQGLLGDTSVTPGGLVFGDGLDVIFINDLGNRTVQVTTFQNASPAIWFNASFAVEGHGATLFSLTLPSTTLTVDTRLCVDNGCMHFLHKTPTLLFPSGILSVGGLDVLAFAITAETLALMAPLTIYARSLTRRALWSPTVRWWLVLPHVVLGFTLLVAAEFPLLDGFFGGLEFALFPVVLAFLWFWWCLHLFNNASPAEALRPDPGQGHGLNFYRWRFIVGDLPDGRKVIVCAGWLQWLARIKGHAPVIVDPEEIKTGEKPIPAGAPLATLRTETRDEKRDRLVKSWLKFRSSPDRPTPFDSFQLIQASALAYREKDPPRLLYWVDSNEWLDVTPPYLTWHRDVKEPAVYGSDGTLVRPPRVRRRWTWPHFVDPPAIASLSGVHWYDQVAAGLDWISNEKISRRNEDLRRENFALRAGVYVKADDLTRGSAEEIFDLLHRERYGISVEEATEEARRSEKETDDDRKTDRADGPTGPPAPPEPEG